MPKHPNILQFSVPSEVLKKLSNLALEGETDENGQARLSLIAKRILLNAIGPDRTMTGPIEPSDLPDRVTAIEGELRQLRETVAALTAPASPQFEEPNLLDLCSEQLAHRVFKLEPTTHLQTYHVIVNTVTEGEKKRIVGFWDGDTFTSHPGYARIYKANPNKKVMARPERRAKNPPVNSDSPTIELLYEPGTAIAMDCFQALKLMGYPNQWQHHDLEKIERKWNDTHLIQ